LIEFGEFAPDQPALDSGGMYSQVAKNCIPRTKGSYGPLGAQSALTNALTAQCQGAAAFRNSAGSVYSFAGDKNDLYLLTGSTYSAVSKSSSPYDAASDDSWEFVQFGDRVIAGNGHTDALQSYVMGTSSAFADLGGSPPKARHIAQIRDFVMVGNTYDGTDGSVANRVWWSAINDPTDWPTIASTDAASKQSDRQDLPSGGWVQAITGAVGGTDGVVFMDGAVYRIVYESPPTVFGFYEVERARGTIAPNSVVNVGDFCFYLSNDGFYVFSGQDSQQIGSQKIDKTFFSRFNQDYPHLVFGAADAINKVVMWVYPSSSSSNADKAVLYNWVLGEWSEAEFNSQVLFRDLTQGYTLDGLDAVGNLDALPYSLDSRIWTGGKDVLTTFDTDNKNATFSGNNLAATFESQEIGGNARILVDAVRPYIDADDNDDITIKMKYRDDTGGSITTTAASSLDSDGSAHFTDVSARYVRAEITVAASASWNHAQGIDAETAAESGS
jgi:hypothetical protein